MLRSNITEVHHWSHKHVGNMINLHLRRCLSAVHARIGNENCRPCCNLAQASVWDSAHSDPERNVSNYVRIGAIEDVLLNDEIIVAAHLRQTATAQKTLHRLQRVCLRSLHALQEAVLADSSSHLGVLRRNNPSAMGVV